MKRILLIFICLISLANTTLANENIIKSENVEDNILIPSKIYEDIRILLITKKNTLKNTLMQYPLYYSDNDIEGIINNIPWEDIYSDFSESFYIMLENGDLNYLRGNYKILRFATEEHIMAAVQKVITAMKNAKYTDNEIYTFIQYSKLEDLNNVKNYSNEVFVPSVYTAIEKGYIVAIAKGTDFFQASDAYYSDEEKMSQLVTYLDELTNTGLSPEECCNIINLLAQRHISENYIYNIISIVDIMALNKYTYDEIMDFVKMCDFVSVKDIEIISPTLIKIVQNKLPFNTLSEAKLKIWYEIYKLSPNLYIKLIEQKVSDPTDKMVEYFSDEKYCNKIFAMLEKRDFSPEIIEKVLNTDKIESKKKISAIKSMQRYYDYEENPYLFDDSRMEAFYMTIAFTLPIAWPALPFGIAYHIGSRSAHAVGRIFYKNGIKNKVKVGL